jgi:hypothetical protein
VLIATVESSASAFFRSRPSWSVIEKYRRISRLASDTAACDGDIGRVVGDALVGEVPPRGVCWLEEGSAGELEQAATATNTNAPAAQLLTPYRVVMPENASSR